MVGNLTRDPELKQLPSGQSVCRLNVASNRQFRNRQTGDMVQEVCYVDVDVWGAQAESSSKYLEKGRQVLIEGRLKLDSWQDAEGNNRSKHSLVADRVVFLSSGNQDGADERETSVGSTQTVAKQEPLEPRNEVERELMAQLDDIKKRTAPQVEAQPATAVKQSSEQSSQNANQVAFKDEPPFQDDLPF
jgi:single-strand DNA-binding protein